jgi:multiple sugar transport system ATP-binding protein
MADIVFEQASKRYGDGFEALKGLDLAIGDGEFLVLVGPSGCGKSTALRMVAGLEDITAGAIRIGGKLVNALAPRDRNIAMVFQSYALYPHLTVRDNIGFGLRVRGMKRDEIARRVNEVARTLELESYLERKPAQLSGGQRQRVAMGRAIVRSPNAFLMDEPLSNLDAKLRVAMRAEVTRIQRLTGVTTIYVTHDQVEAMTMGDRVAVLDKGVLQQLGPPKSLYRRPANRFVAGFIGSPAMNFFECPLVAEGEELSLCIDAQRWRLADAWSLVLAPYAGKTISLGIRPEHFTIIAHDDQPGVRARVVMVEELGATILVHLSTKEKAHLLAEAIDADTATAARSEFLAIFDAETAIAPGDVLTLGVAPIRMHFFDPATGLALEVSNMPRET